MVYSGFQKTSYQKRPNLVFFWFKISLKLVFIFTRESWSQIVFSWIRFWIVSSIGLSCLACKTCSTSSSESSESPGTSTVERNSSEPKLLNPILFMSFILAFPCYIHNFDLFDQTSDAGFAIHSINPFRGRRHYSGDLFFPSFFFTASIVWALGRSNFFSSNIRCLGNSFLSFKFRVALYTISYKQLTMKKCKDFKLNSVMKSFYRQIHWYLVYGRFKARWLRIQ